MVFVPSEHVGSSIKRTGWRAIKSVEICMLIGSIEENEHHSVVSMLKMINFPGITFSYGVEAMFLSLSIDLVVPD